MRFENLIDVKTGEVLEVQTEHREMHEVETLAKELAEKTLKVLKQL